MTSLTLVRRIRARPQIVFDALVQPEGISQWWGPDAGPVLVAETDVRVGGAFRVRFRRLDGSEHETQGEYLQIEPPRRLAMTWRWVFGGGDAGQSMLEFDIRPLDEGVELTLVHSRLGDEDARVSHQDGWNGALDKLVHNLTTTEEGNRHEQA